MKRANESLIKDVYAMLHRICLVLAGFFLSLTILSKPLLASAPPLVDADWVKANLGKPGIIFVDMQGAKGFERAHIPGAASTDYGLWRKRSAKGIPAQLPGVEYLEKLIGGMGIDADTHVVITPIGQSASDLSAATRIYWTFKAMGHKDISILNGGLIDYAINKRYPLANGTAAPPAKTYTAKPDLHVVADAEDLLKAIENGTSIVDARTPREFTGKLYGRGERPGSVPGAKLQTHATLTKPKTGILPDTATLKAMFEKAGIPTSGPQIAYCHTGNRASLNWFVAHELLGNKEARLYDGSMIEWARNKAYPMVIPK